MKSYQEYIKEQSLGSALISKLRKLSHPKEYAYAAKTLFNVLKRKSKANQIRHDLYYYASEIAKSVSNVDTKELVNFYVDSGYDTFGLKL